MTTFERVNGGVAFSTGNTFSPTHAENMRANGELLWRNGTLRFTRETVTPSDVSAAALSHPGRPIWNPHLRCYVAVSGKTGSTPKCEVTYISPNGGASVHTFTGPTAIGTNVPAQLFGCEASGYNYLLYQNGGTGSLYVDSTWGAVSSWSNKLGAAAALDFTMSTPERSGSGVKMSDSVIVVGGTNVAATGSRLLWLSLDSSGGITSQAVGGRSGGNYINSIATNGTVAVATERLDASGGPASSYVLTCTIGGSIGYVSMPFHSAATGSTDDNRFVAYDRRLGVFVAMHHAAAGGIYEDQLMWTTSSDGTTWSATTGWKRLPMPFASAGHVFFPAIRDFVILADGTWLVSLEIVGIGPTRYILSSIDGGASWALNPVHHDINCTYYGLANDGPVPLIQGNEVNSYAYCHYLIGGRENQGTALSAVAI